MRSESHYGRWRGMELEMERYHEGGVLSEERITATGLEGETSSTQCKESYSAGLRCRVKLRVADR